MSLFLSIALSLYSLRLLLSLSCALFLSLSLSLSLSRSRSHVPSLSLFLFLSLCFCIFISLSLSLSLCVCICISLSLSLSICVCLSHCLPNHAGCFASAPLCLYLRLSPTLSAQTCRSSLPLRLCRASFSPCHSGSAAPVQSPAACHCPVSGSMCSVSCAVL